MRLSLALLLLCVVGCHSDPPDSMITAVAAAVAAADALATQKYKFGPRWPFYVMKRVQYFLSLDISYGLPPFTFLITRIGNEALTLANYVESKIGFGDTVGPLGGATDSSGITPPHADLSDVAKRRVVDEDADAVDQNLAEFIRYRRDAIRGIVYRAPAIHRELWRSADTDLDPTLDLATLDIALDRRLRIVERMRYTDDAQGFPPDWQIQHADSGWTDNHRTILFEYPFIDVDDNLKAALIDAGLDINNLGNGFTYNEQLSQLSWPHGGRLRPDAVPNFVPIGDGYSYQIASRPDLTPAQALDSLIPSTSPVDVSFADFWQRNWLFCDPMIATLHLDALRFALARANGNDDQFNEVASQGAFIGPLLNGGDKPDPTVIMTAGAALYDGALVRPSELQIGDHLIFWNSFFVRAVIGDAYGLENSLVMDADTDDPREAKLAGHGISTKGYRKFADGMVRLVREQFKRARKEIFTRYHTDNSTVYFDLTYSGFTYHVMRWDPYDSVDFQPADTDQLHVPGVWWIRIILAETLDEHRQPLTLARGLQLFPQAVALRPTQAKPENAPDWGANYKESIFLPLSRPNGIRGGWKAYFDARDNDTNTDDAIDLDDMKVDRSWVLGFFYNGPGSLIPVFRPKLTS
jgi:hypothetical protein